MSDEMFREGFEVGLTAWRSDRHLGVENMLAKTGLAACGLGIAALDTYHMVLREVGDPAWTVKNES